MYIILLFLVWDLFSTYS